jgi:hypothetical protein
MITPEALSETPYVPLVWIDEIRRFPDEGDMIKKLMRLHTKRLDAWVLTLEPPDEADTRVVYQTQWCRTLFTVLVEYRAKQATAAWAYVDAKPYSAQLQHEDAHGFVKSLGLNLSEPKRVIWPRDSVVATLAGVMNCAGIEGATPWWSYQDNPPCTLTCYLPFADAGTKELYIRDLFTPDTPCTLAFTRGLFQHPLSQEARNNSDDAVRAASAIKKAIETLWKDVVTEDKTGTEFWKMVGDYEQKEANEQNKEASGA